MKKILDKKRRIRIKDVVVLMANAYMADKDAQIGFNDADRTLADFIQSLDTIINVNEGVLESGLYCCNMLNELDSFWHPDDDGFDTFSRTVLEGKEFFDKDYNFITTYDKQIKRGKL